MDLARPQRLARLLLAASVTAVSTLACVVGWHILSGSPLMAVVAARAPDPVVPRCGWSATPTLESSVMPALLILGATILFLALGRCWTLRLVRREIEKPR